ncbi:MAG: hypothetical protein R2771_14360 [Saprospiraceae bacterium]
MTISAYTNLNSISIEYSIDCIDFIEIGKMNFENPDSFKSQSSYLHTDPDFGMIYYRLKLINNDGNYTYSGRS